ncbi:zf-HC2 domain-containing protein [bacterium]|nr:zf-HC2 domain-containing protein [bacterium]
MNKNLTCNQVAALINFYIEDKLNPRLKEYVNMHLEKCPVCRKKITELQKILSKFNQYKTNSENQSSEPLKAEFINNLSAYIDNELTSNDNIKIKKMAISNPTARKELESLYKYRQLINSAYERTKNESKYDYSKDVISKLQDNTDYTTTYFYKLAFVFIIIVTAIIGGFIYLYF